MTKTKFKTTCKKSWLFTKNFIRKGMEFKITCKKSWLFTKNFIHKGMEFNIRVIKALKYSITTH